MTVMFNFKRKIFFNQITHFNPAIGIAFFQGASVVGITIFAVK